MRIDVGFSERLTRERGWRGRERLSRRGVLAWHVGPWDRPFLDRPDRFTSDPIKDVQEPILARLGDRIDAPAFATDRDELGCRHQIPIPQVVVNCLKVPDALASPRVQREDAVAVEVIARAIRAVPVHAGRAGRYVNNAASLIERHVAPVIVPTGVFIGFRRVALVAELPWPRD